MSFLEPKLEVFLEKLSVLSSEKKPNWGTMSPQRMVEHLTDSLVMAREGFKVKLEIPEEHVSGALKFLRSEKPMPRNFKVKYASGEIPNRNADIPSAVEELATEWKNFEDYFVSEDMKTLHPVYGEIDYDTWMLVHSKHFTHHFEQFDL